jgi:hypothetical protein
MIGPTDLLHPSPAPHFKTLLINQNYVLIKKTVDKCRYIVATERHAVLIHISTSCQAQQQEAEMSI